VDVQSRKLGQRAVVQDGKVRRAPAFATLHCEYGVAIVVSHVPPIRIHRALLLDSRVHARGDAARSCRTSLMHAV
jgi:hypothetical protein